MRSLSRRASYGLKRVGGMGAVGIALFVFSLAMFVSTVAPMREQLRAYAPPSEGSAEQPARAPAARSAPAASPTRQWLASLPAREDLPDVLDRIFVAASQSGIELERGDYEYLPVSANRALARYRASFPVRGRYQSVYDFVDRSLVSVPAMALTGVSMERESVLDAVISAEIEFEVFVGGQP